MRTTAHSLGDVLRGHRMNAGLTQRELAHRAAVSVRTLRDIERSRVARPHVRSILRLVAALGLPTADRDRLLAMLGGGDPPPSVAELWILGPLAVRVGGRPADVDQPMRRALLGLLGLHVDELVTTEEIVETLWPNRPPRTCRSLVRDYAGDLRALLQPRRSGRSSPDVIVRTPIGYRLALDPERVDLSRFDALSERARRAQAAGAHEEAMRLYVRALSGWRGPVLSDCLPRVRQHPAAVAAGQRRLRVALAASDAALSIGRYDVAADVLRELTRVEPPDGLSAAVTPTRARPASA